MTSKQSVRPRGMTASGKRWAALFGLVLAFMLPKRVPCGYPDGAPCQRPGALGALCTPHEIEPFGFYLLEAWLDRDVGFAYSAGQDCR